MRHAARAPCAAVHNPRVGDAITVVLADDIEVVAVAAVYDEVVAAAERLAPQAVVTDIRMPPDFQREGIDAAKEIRKRHPGTGIVILSQYDDSSVSELRLAASWPEAALDAPRRVALSDGRLPSLPHADRAAPVRHQNELLGVLTIEKPRGETSTPAEDKLLNDLAAQAGLVLRNVGLTAELLARLEELKASRQRLVSAQDEERRRLERSLHDGAQQHWSASRSSSASPPARPATRLSRTRWCPCSRTPTRRSRRSATSPAASTRRSSPTRVLRRR